MNEMFDEIQTDEQKARYKTAASEEFFWLAIDTETGGFTPKDSDLIEIAAVAYKGGSEVASFDHLILPTRPWNAQAQKDSHGITEAEALAEGIPCIKALEHLCKWASKAHAIVAYNHKFDKRFIDFYCYIHGLKMPDIPWVDPYEVSKVLLGGQKLPNLKLATVARHLGVPLPTAHRAEPDARAAGNVLLELLASEKLLLDEVAISGIKQIGSEAIGLPISDAIYDAFPRQFGGKKKK